MLSLTRKTDYALVALAELAWLDSGRASARQISDRTGVPLPVLTNILHQLVGSGVVRSRQGVKGGYELSKSPAETTITEIIEAIEGPFLLTICGGEEGSVPVGHACDMEPSCRIKEPIRRLQKGLREYLCKVTLESMVDGIGPNCAGPITVGVERSPRDGGVTTINSDSGNNDNGKNDNGGLDACCHHSDSGRAE